MSTIKKQTGKTHLKKVKTLRHIFCYPCVHLVVVVAGDDGVISLLRRGHLR